MVGVGVAGGMMLRRVRRKARPCGMTAARIALPPRPRILVIALRRLGDVLLTTPLIRSIRRAWPDARIDALVFADTAGILEGNPDIDRVIAMPPRPSARESLARRGAGVRSLRPRGVDAERRPADRLCGARSAAARGAGRRSVQRSREARAAARAASRTTSSCTASKPCCGSPMRSASRACPRWSPPQGGRPDDLPQGAYAVIHAAPMFTYKQWTVEGWRAVAEALAARGLTVIATGGPGTEERAYLDEVWRGAPVVRYDGKLTWPATFGAAGARARLMSGPIHP